MDTNGFDFPGLLFLPVYNPRVATNSFDQKRERGFDEQLVHILSSAEALEPISWGGNVGNYNHVLTPAEDDLECLLWHVLWLNRKKNKRESRNLLSPLVSYIRKQAAFWLHCLKQRRTQHHNNPSGEPASASPSILLVSGRPCFLRKVLKRTLFHVAAIKLTLAKGIPRESNSFKSGWDMFAACMKASADAAGLWILGPQIHLHHILLSTFSPHRELPLWLALLKRRDE